MCWRRRLERWARGGCWGWMGWGMMSYEVGVLVWCRRRVSIEGRLRIPVCFGSDNEYILAYFVTHLRREEDSSQTRQTSWKDPLYPNHHHHRHHSSKCVPPNPIPLQRQPIDTPYPPPAPPLPQATALSRTHPAIGQDGWYLSTIVPCRTLPPCLTSFDFNARMSPKDQQNRVVTTPKIAASFAVQCQYPEN